MIKQLVLVGLGGAFGSILRFLTSMFTLKYHVGLFPLGTFLVNIVGCLLIGLFIGVSERNQLMGADLRLLLVTGFCGGYTTFSTFSSENLQLIQNGNYVMFVFYTLLSIFLGILAVYVGFLISK